MDSSLSQSPASLADGIGTASPLVSLSMDAVKPDRLPDHPAVLAWSKLQCGHVPPQRIEVLKKGGKLRVFRLPGVGRGGAAVIAKRCPRAKALVERTIYEKVLPRLPLPTLHFYGSVEAEKSSAWLFVEDAGSQEFSRRIEEHRTLAARWTAALHVAARNLSMANRLPDRGPGYFRQLLPKVRLTMERNLANPLLRANDIAMLKCIASQCDLLETRWPEVEALCDGMASTVIHGDLVEQNVRIGTGQDEVALLVYDWEWAGWGMPAIDLAQNTFDVVSLDLRTYWSCLTQSGSDVSLNKVQRWALCGGFFRELAAIDCESWPLAYPCQHGHYHEWLAASLKSMRLHQKSMADVMRKARWEK